MVEVHRVVGSSPIMSINMKENNKDEQKKEPTKCSKCGAENCANEDSCWYRRTGKRPSYLVLAGDG